MALLLVGDQPSAEDVVQEAFLGLFRGLGRLSDPGRAVAYLRISVLNGCRSVLRARKRARLRGAATEYPVVWSAESAALADEDRREVLAAVARLPRRQREVLVFRYFLGLSDREIAADLGISRGTVASTASRALAALAKTTGEQASQERGTPMALGTGITPASMRCRLQGLASSMTRSTPVWPSRSTGPAARRSVISSSLPVHQ
jgi:RNA polymerase sigma factor (sigma-70 family)